MSETLSPPAAARQGSTPTLHACGPIAIQLSSDRPVWHERAAALLALYMAWAERPAPLSVQFHTVEQDTALGASGYLRTVSMHVDQTSTGLVATCRSGACARQSASGQHWDLCMPRRYADRAAGPADVDDNLEDMLELVLTTAWREAGWIPLHAGAVVQGTRCALVTAPSRGGKTTFTLAMLHRGWQTLGDDKLLVKPSGHGRAELYALQAVFNIDPQARQWFPQIGDLSHLPLDSVWTPKRRLPIAHLWPGRMLTRALPTHLVQVQRYLDHRPARASELSAGELLSALLRQTVVPSERAAASLILAVITTLARQLRGVRFELGQDAYAEPRTLDLMERMLA